MNTPHWSRLSTSARSVGACVLVVASLFPGVSWASTVALTPLLAPPESAKRVQNVRQLMSSELEFMPSVDGVAEIASVPPELTSLCLDDPGCLGSVLGRARGADALLTGSLAEQGSTIRLDLVYFRAGQIQRRQSYTVPADVTALANQMTEILQEMLTGTTASQEEASLVSASDFTEEDDDFFFEEPPQRPAPPPERSSYSFDDLDDDDVLVDAGPTPEELAYQQAQAQREAQLRAQREAQRRAQQEAQLRAQQEAQRRAREEAQRRAQEEAARRAREEAARLEAQRRAEEELRRREQQAAAPGFNISFASAADQIEAHDIEAAIQFGPPPADAGVSTDAGPTFGQGAATSSPGALSAATSPYGQASTSSSYGADTPSSPYGVDTPSSPYGAGTTSSPYGRPSSYGSGATPPYGASTYGASTASPASSYGQAVTASASPYGAAGSSPYGSGVTASAVSPYGPGSTASPYGAGTTSSPYGAGTTSSPYGAGTTSSPYGAAAAVSASPYGAATTASPYGSGATSPYGPVATTSPTSASPYTPATTPSPYGQAPTSPYGAASTSSPYGQASSPALPYGQAPAPSPYGSTTSPYGQAPTPSPYGSAAPAYGSAAPASPRGQPSPYGQAAVGVSGVYTAPTQSSTERRSDGEADAGDDARFRLTGRGGYARYGAFNFYTGGVELTFDASPGIALLAGIELYAVRRELPRNDQDIEPSYKWNRIYPFNVGVVYRLGAGSAIRPYFGADFIVTQYYQDPEGNGSEWAAGARGRGGLDYMITPSVGLNANLAVGVWSGKKWTIVDPNVNNTDLLPQVSSGVVAVF